MKHKPNAMRQDYTDAEMAEMVAEHQGESGVGGAFLFLIIIAIIFALVS